MWIVWLEKKILKTLGFLLGILLILGISLHIYLVNNAEYLLEELVRTRSDNKLGLKVKNISFNYFSNKIGLEKVSFFSNDTADINTAYRFDIEKIQLRVNGLIQLFTKKELVIDSLFLNSPHIEVTRIRKASEERKDVSIAEEMGRIYNSILDALALLHVTRFEMNDGRFTLKNQVVPDQKPLHISNLYIRIDNLNIDSTGTAEKFFTGNQMEFRTKNQDILFPDGNHRLAFSNFRINIMERQIEIDSCTLFGQQPGNDRAGYTVFLDALRLVNVDFKALYENEIIKADSVHCLKPEINLRLEVKQRSGESSLPNLDSVIQDLTGNLNLQYIGVQNADLNLTTFDNNQPTTFTSRDNNFEMEELVINHSLPHPVSLKSFSTAIRNYENFIKDSSYFLRFDSILLKEKQILLSNFSINSEPYRDTRNIRVRRFALSGLSWEELLYNRKVKARQAILYDPSIDYVQPAVKMKKSKSLLASLEGIYRIMDLEKLQVLNGKIKVVTRDKDEILLQNTDLLITLPDPGSIDEVTELERVIDDLYFEKGNFRINNMVAHAENSHYSGASNQLSFDRINVYDQSQLFNISAGNVRLDSLSYDDSLKKISSAGLSWRQGKLEINRDTVKGNNNFGGISIELKKSDLQNTSVLVNNTGGSLSVLLSSLSTGQITGMEKLRVESLRALGKEFNWFKPGTDISFTDFRIKDDSASVISSFMLKQELNGNLTTIIVPQIDFNPDISSVINKKPVFENVIIKNPDIGIIIQNAESKTNRSVPDLAISNLVIEKPVFRFSNKAKGLNTISWDGLQNNMKIENLSFDKLADQALIGSVTGNLSKISITDSAGKKMNIGTGEINYSLNQFIFHNNENPAWSFSLKELSAQGFKFDSLGKDHGVIDLKHARAENIMVNDKYITDLRELIRSNQQFRLSNISASYVSTRNRMELENLSFNRDAKRMTLDSFSLYPVKSRDEFIFSSPWQTDYITMASGPVSIEEIDVDRLLTDSTVQARTVTINNPVFTAYRDKRPPFHAGIIKPLPSKLLQQIPFRILIDTMYVENGTTIYSELNDVTGRTGVVPVTRISGDVFPIKNTEIAATDSFRIRLNGYILDTAWIRLRTRESFADSLSGFIITLRMRPGSLMYLNEVLDPLAGLTLKSGYLDTLNMRAIGKDHLSLGEMSMLYHDLKVEFQRNGTEEKKKFLRGLKTFIANSFVIKNENKKRTGVVYFPRLRDRSFINYYVKMAFSGVASNIGARKNKKILRKYRKELKIRNLPPIDF